MPIAILYSFIFIVVGMIYNYINPGFMRIEIFHILAYIHARIGINWCLILDDDISADWFIDPIQMTACAPEISQYLLLFPNLNPCFSRL